MTTSRIWFLAVLLLAAGMAEAQTQPKDLPWAVAELAGGGDWAVRLPQLLVRGWTSLPAHRVTDAEKTALRQRFLDETLASLDKQTSRLLLDLDRKRLAGALPSSEPEATMKALAALAVQRNQALAGETAGAAPPETLAFRPVWSPGRDNLPWAAAARPVLLSRSKALYLIDGSVRMVGTYLSVKLELYSDVEKRVLASWEGQFAPDEAPEKAAEAADRFRSSLLGRPWSGLVLSSATAGSQVHLHNRWHHLPWSSDELTPGPLNLRVRSPGRPEETVSVVLEPEVRHTVALESNFPSADPIVLETEPPGVPLYLDSRYLGLSPQTVDRPFSLTRVRAQPVGGSETAWEIGPTTISPSRMVLRPPQALRSVPEAKDGFYFSLAAFSFSLTASAFAGAWVDEQVKLTNAYATAGAVAGYTAALNRYRLASTGYAASVVLTSAVFVWMMFELGDYLDAAQASLP